MFYYLILDHYFVLHGLYNRRIDAYSARPASRRCPIRFKRKISVLFSFGNDHCGKYYRVVDNVLRLEAYVIMKMSCFEKDVR
jgi:hypothetical protein